MYETITCVISTSFLVLFNNNLIPGFPNTITIVHSDQTKVDTTFLNYTYDSNYVNLIFQYNYNSKGIFNISIYANELITQRSSLLLTNCYNISNGKFYLI